MLKRQIQRGDTLIEVLFAFSILSLVIIGAITIMNQGTVAAQRALETTLVREEIDSQATTLRFLHDAYVAAYQTRTTYDSNAPAGQWKAMTDSLVATSASAFNGAASCPNPPTGSFILNGAQAKYIKGDVTVLKQATTFSQVTYDSSSSALIDAQGIWIEGIKSPVPTDVNAQNTGYIDFHIRACWNNPGQGPAMTIGTIVRLYEPRG